MKRPTLDVKKLTSGMRIKNYKELCSLLNLEERTGKAKQLQMDALQKYYFSFTKDGYAIVIDEIYQKPVLEKLTKRKGKYSDDLTNNILVYIDQSINSHSPIINYSEGYDAEFDFEDRSNSNEDVHDLYITKNKLMLAMGMFNEKYPRKKIGNDFEFQFPTEKGKDYSIDEFYKIANSKLTEILINSLNALKRRYLITWDSVFFKGYKNGNGTNELATREEQVYIMSVLHNQLLEFNVDTEYDIIINNQTDEFYEQVNEIIKKELGCDYIYKVIHITNFKKENIKYEINRRVDKHRFNLKIVEGLKETVNNKVENRKDRSSMEKEIGLNMNSFFYPIYFKDSQNALIDYLIQIKNAD